MACPFKQIVPSSSAAGDLSSSLKQAEVSLAKENTKSLYAGDNNINRIVTFMQESPDAAFLLDHEGKVVYRNKAAQLMFPMNNLTLEQVCVRYFPSPLHIHQLLLQHGMILLLI